MPADSDLTMSERVALAYVLARDRQTEQSFRLRTKLADFINRLAATDKPLIHIANRDVPLGTGMMPFAFGRNGQIGTVAGSQRISAMAQGSFSFAPIACQSWIEAMPVSPRSPSGARRGFR